MSNTNEQGEGNSRSTDISTKSSLLLVLASPIFSGSLVLLILMLKSCQLLPDSDAGCGICFGPLFKSLRLEKWAKTYAAPCKYTRNIKDFIAINFFSKKFTCKKSE